MPEHDFGLLDQNRKEPEQQRRYEAPRILFREPLEGVAVACLPEPPGKADLVACGQAQS